MQKNDIVTIEIESLSNDGSGVGRLNGMAVFVPYSAPGDRLAVRLVKLAKTHAFGRIEQILSPGRERVAPLCPAFGRCGGCDLCHLEYAAQLEAKRRFVRDALTRLGGLELEVNETVASPSASRYRNKVQYPVTTGAGGEISFGYFAKRSHRVVPCADCRLQPALLNKIAARACALFTERGLTAYDEGSRSGLVRHLLLRRSGKTGEVMLCVVLNGQGFAGEKEFAQRISADFPEIGSVVVNRNSTPGNVILGPHYRTVWGSGLLGDEICGVPVRLSPPSFFQINTPAAELLYERAAALADPAPGDTLLDLYCGAGTIGLSVARRFALRRLIGVEAVPDAVRDARGNAAALGLGNCEFLLADAGAAASTLAARGQHVDIAVVDPPRKGCSGETLAALAAMAPKRIVMISCNPATLARDLRALCALGYRPGAVTPVDLFPNTAHCEAIVALQREPGGAPR